MSGEGYPELMMMRWWGGGPPRRVRRASATKRRGSRQRVPLRRTGCLRRRSWRAGSSWVRARASLSLSPATSAGPGTPESAAHSLARACDNHTMGCTKMSQSTGAASRKTLQRGSRRARAWRGLQGSERESARVVSSTDRAPASLTGPHSANAACVRPIERQPRPQKSEC